MKTSPGGGMQRTRLTGGDAATTSGRGGFRSFGNSSVANEGTLHTLRARRRVAE